MKLWFKLYPWEFLVTETFGENLTLPDLDFDIVEPAWKMILSNKAILPVLWRLFTNHPNLLPAFFDEEEAKAEFKNDGYERKGLALALFLNWIDWIVYCRFVKKPLLSREGANVTLVAGSVVEQTSGDYGKEGFVYQKVCIAPKFGDYHAIIGMKQMEFGSLLYY